MISEEEGVHEIQRNETAEENVDGDCVGGDLDDVRDVGGLEGDTGGHGCRDTVAGGTNGTIAEDVSGRIETDEDVDPGEVDHSSRK